MIKCATMQFHVALAACLAYLTAADPVGVTQPWGVHIAYGDDPKTIMQAMWSTRNAANPSVVSLGTSPSSLATYFTGTSHQFSDVNNTQYIHHAIMSGLKAGTQYFYTVGDGNKANTSQVFNFTTAEPEQGPVVFGFLGDFGIDVNAHKTLPYLTADVMSGAIDIVLHVGDIAYDLDSNNGANGDTFVVNAQPYSAYVPTHYCPGNHESAEDFFQYINRFDMMPGNETGNSAFHSFNVGYAHIIMFSSEAYFYVSNHGLALLPTQYAWLEADMAAVDRAVTPWLVTMAHRPLYCSPNDDSDDCHSILSIVRDGIVGQYGMETLLYKYGVDVHLGAHEHSYERNYPVYQFMWNPNITGDAAYVDYDRPIHLLNGAAGCPEDQDPWQTDGNPFSALRVNAYGYGRLHVVNVTHALWEFINDASGEVIDSLYFIQHSHGPYTSGLDTLPASERLAAWEATMEHIKKTSTGKPYTGFKHGAMPGHVHDPARETPELGVKELRRIGEENLRALRRGA